LGGVEGNATGGAYDRLAYPGYAYAATHPARLEVIGRLFGLEPEPARSCRVLELGCGDGGNALSIACTLPQAEVLGVDASPTAIERGSALAQAAGIENVELRCATFEQLADDIDALATGPGERKSSGFDYIVSHGVYSWVPPQARAALLDCIRRCLAPKGIAFVSYNAYPGSYLRDMARDILGYHVRDIADPERKLGAAQELMQAIVAIEEPSPFARVLREHMERMLSYSDALLFHDDLAEVSTPFYFHEVVEHANRHGLRFLAEADLAESQMRDLPDSAAKLIAGLPDDMVVREQYLDFFKNRMFRQTLLCHAEAPGGDSLDDREIERLWISSSARPEDGGVFATPEGFTVTTSEPLVVAALNALAGVWPGALSFEELLARAVEDSGVEAPLEEAAARLREVLLQAYLARIVHPLGCPLPVAASPSERPMASALARAQHAADSSVLSSLLHANVRLEGELEPRLLPLLDGTQGYAELAQSLAVSEEQVTASLARFTSLGLLAHG
jgi:SAM-dependent methyltransferase